MWDELIYPFPNFNGCTVEVWEWIRIFISLWEWISNLISHFAVHVITYPCWDSSKTMLVKGPQVGVNSFIYVQIDAPKPHV